MLLIYVRVDVCIHKEINLTVGNRAVEGQGRMGHGCAYPHPQYMQRQAQARQSPQGPALPSPLPYSQDQGSGSQKRKSLFNFFNTITKHHQMSTKHYFV